MSEEPKKIIIDDDWKEQAKKEKEKLATEKEAASQEMPPVSFLLLVNSFAMQAMMSMGLFPNPMTNETEKDLAAAKHYIDLLAILEEKTKGNLTDEENKALSLTLHDLRMAYVEVAK